MNARESFWERVDEILDARGDPASDPELRAWIAAHPEDARELAELRSALGVLEHAREIHAPLRRASSRWFLVAGAGLAAALVIVALALRHDRDRDASTVAASQVVVAHARPAAASVQFWEIEITTESSAGTRRTRAGSGLLERSGSRGSSAGASPELALAFSVRTERSVTP